MKKLRLILTLICILLAAASSVEATTKYINLTLTYDNKKHDYTAEEVFVAINGSKLNNLPMQPIILNGYTLVPAREVFEAVGAEVEWNKDLEQVFVTYGSKLVVIPINSSKSYVNGISTIMQADAKIINNKTMIPLRFVSSAVGFDVQWDNSTRVANIITKDHDDEENDKQDEETTTVTVEPTTEATTTTEITTSQEETTNENNPNYSAINQQISEKTNPNYSSGSSLTPRYNEDTGELILCSADVIDINNMIHSDDYYNLVYTITIPGDYTKVIESQTYMINNDKIAAIYVDAGYNETKIIIDENRILACDVYTRDGAIIVKPCLPKEKYDKIIVLDAGHGGSDPGASGQGLVEKNLTLNMLLKTKAMFDNDGKIKCYVTRATDTYPSFDDRTNLGNEVGDAFISIHINSATNASATGTETYQLNPNDQGNGLTSYMLAESILNNLLNNLDTVNRKVKSENFIVLRQSNIPASLIEIGFITNSHDAEIMGSDSGQQAVAKSIFDSVTDLFNEHPPVR